LPGLVLLCAGAAAACSHPQKSAGSALATPSRATSAAARPGRAGAQGPPPASERDLAIDTGKGDKEERVVFFDFDSALLRDDARPVLQKVAEVARQREAKVRVEGNCDELGTTEYNLALGEHRAIEAKDYLVHLGVPPARIETISFGSQRPKAPGHDEQAHAENRRDDLIVK
jgi:peptidoglycan-associated lipoprotein